MINLKPYYPGAYHMVNTDAFEPQRTNNFEIQFPSLGDLVSADGTVYSDCGKKITLSVADAGDLSTNISAIAVPYGNNAVKFAGKPELQNISITINDFIGLDTERILEAWSTLVYNKKTQLVGKAFNNGNGYKKRGYLIEYSPDYEISKVWQLEGCWPGTITYGGYSQDGNSMRRITMDLNIDIAVPLDNSNQEFTAFQN